jgi:diguanylate cyclase (GGDEF)-like protein
MAKSYIRQMPIIISLIILILLTGCTNANFNTKNIPISHSGVISLDSWNFNQDGMINLDGDWEFYWNKFYEPKDFINGILESPTYITVPANWNQLKDSEYPRHGYATYRLTVNNIPNGIYAIRLPNVSTAYKIWANDKLLGENGHLSSRPEEVVASNNPQEFGFHVNQETLQLTFQVENYHFRDGGIFSSIELGTFEQVMDKTNKKIIFDTVLFGSLFLAGLYHLILFYLRKSDLIALYFGLFCIMVSIRVMVIGEKFLLRVFTNISYEWAIKLEYLSFYICLPLFLWFTYCLFRELVSKKICKVITIIASVFITVVLLTPPNIFSYTVYYYELLTLVIVVYLIFILIKAMAKKEEGAILITICGSFFALTVVNDILFYNMIINTMELSPFGLFVFIFSQSYLIANRFSYAFTRVEHVSNQLAILNTQLEDKVNERTRSLREYQSQLEQANHKLHHLSYFDATTGIANKRYFTEEIEKMWQNAKQSQTYLSLLFIDIDCFKEFNDTNGHLEGDRILKRVAETLESRLKKYNGVIARYGGEEFIALLPQMGVEEAYEVAEKCRIDILNLQIIHKTSTVSNVLTVSIGLASQIPTDDDIISAFIFEGDKALYLAKSDGRNKVVIQEKI